LDSFHPSHKSSLVNEISILESIKNPATKRSGFDTLVKTYQQKVYWLVRKMVIDHDESNDLTQDIFIKVWFSIDAFEGKSKLYTWIYRIAVNECLMYLRKRKQRHSVSLENVDNEMMSYMDHSELVDGDQIQILLQKAILTLPDKQRMVFNLKYFEEMKYEDMSELLGTSVGALKASFHLAVKKIEEYMNKLSNAHGN